MPVEIWSLILPSEATKSWIPVTMLHHCEANVHTFYSVLLTVQWHSKQHSCLCGCAITSQALQGDPIRDSQPRADGNGDANTACTCSCGTRTRLAAAFNTCLSALLASFEIPHFFRGKSPPKEFPRRDWEVNVAGNV